MLLGVLEHGCMWLEELKELYKETVRRNYIKLKISSAGCDSR